MLNNPLAPCQFASMSSASKIQEWIEQQLANHPPRAKSLVMTVFGDAIAPHGGVIWLGRLISLMSHFGVSERLVRTSVFRLLEEGWLEAKREGRRSSYRLARASYIRFQHAYERVYFPKNPTWDHNWTLVIIGNDDIMTTNKTSLKKELYWEGFRMINTGVFAHPQADTAALEEILLRTELAGQLLVCNARDIEKISSRPLSSIIAAHWQLAEVNANYQQFMASFLPLSHLLNGQSLSGHAAFAIRTLLIHSFRRAQLHDPHLPVPLRPKEWFGDEAYQLCRHLYQACYAPAEELLKPVLEQKYKEEVIVSM